MNYNDKIAKLNEEILSFKMLYYDELPDIDLYMDQVIQLFESKLSEQKRKEDEKPIQTKITKLSFIYDNLFLYENKQNKTKKRKSHSIMLSRSKTNKTLVLKTTTFFSPKNQSRNKKLIRLKSK